MPSAPSYSLVNTEELAKLASVNASGSVFAVYSVLCAFARKSKACFPSIKTISSVLGDAYHRTTIQKALKFLEDHQIIKRASRRSKSRFQMTYRRAIQKLKAIIGDGAECSQSSSQECSQSSSRRKQEGRRTYKHNKRNSRFHYQAPPPTKEDLKEEAIAKFVMNGTIDDNLVANLEKSDWDWLQSYHPKKAKLLLELQSVRT
jgi:predicted transcriptional regulator